MCNIVGSKNKQLQVKVMNVTVLEDIVWGIHSQPGTNLDFTVVSKYGNDLSVSR